MTIPTVDAPSDARQPISLMPCSYCGLPTTSTPPFCSAECDRNHRASETTIRFAATSSALSAFDDGEPWRPGGTSRQPRIVVVG